MSNVSNSPSWPLAELAQQEWEAIRLTAAPESAKRAKREAWALLMMECVREAGTPGA
jgi:hypothetical protein